VTVALKQTNRSEYNVEVESESERVRVEGEIGRATVTLKRTKRSGNSMEVVKVKG